METEFKSKTHKNRFSLFLPILPPLTSKIGNVLIRYYGKKLKKGLDVLKRMQQAQICKFIRKGLCGYIYFCIDFSCLSLYFRRNILSLIQTRIFAKLFPVYFKALIFTQASLRKLIKSYISERFSVRIYKRRFFIIAVTWIVQHILSLIMCRRNVKDDLPILGSQRGLLSYLQGGGQISAQEDVAAGSQEKVGFSMNNN